MCLFSQDPAGTPEVGTIKTPLYRRASRDAGRCSGYPQSQNWKPDTIDHRMYLLIPDTLVAPPKRFLSQ